MIENLEFNAAPDPFNPASLRLDPSYVETMGVRKLLITVPVRKPNKQEFVRVHPEPMYRLTPAAIRSRPSSWWRFGTGAEAP